MGAGSIGRTYRGDFARWHLNVGRHRFETIPANQFSVFVARGGAGSAHVLSTIRPETLTGWNWDLPEGAGTYSGLFPYAWFEYDWDELPVKLRQRQFSPIIPGNYRESTYPVGLFEWEIENPGPEPLTVGLMFSWANDIGRDGGLDLAGGHRNVAVRRDGMAGVVMHGQPDEEGGPWNGSFAIMAEEADGVRLTTWNRFSVDDGADVWADFGADGALSDFSDSSSARPGEAIGAALAATVDLAPGARKLLSFALAWDLPVAEFGSGTRWHKRYTRFFGLSGTRAWEIGAEALRNRTDWAAGIDAWQEPILADAARPDWYKCALFNELYYLVDGGTVWTDGAPFNVSGHEAGAMAEALAEPRATNGHADPIGHFAVLECYDYVCYNTLDVNFYASWALLLLWPRLDVGTLRDFGPTVDIDDPTLVEHSWMGGRTPRKLPGAMPHDMGGPSEDPFLRPNIYNYRDINIWKDLNSKFVLQVWRDVVLVPAPELARDLWPAVVKAMDYLGRFDRDGDGLPEHDGMPDQTYDQWSMLGPSAYSGALWLAALRAGIRMGTVVGDEAVVARWSRIHDLGSAAFEDKLWNGICYRFDTSRDDATAPIMADQLAGQWYADAIGLGDLAAPERIETALRTIFEMNVLGFRGGEMGAVNGMLPDGSIDESNEQSAESWVGTSYALAAFMIGRGLTEEGWRTARGAYEFTYGHGLWFRTPEGYLEDGRYRAAMYLRPLAIWAIEHALHQIEERNEATIQGGGRALAAVRD
jgi:non-lysosomal glucosylceramidase